jgi:hypothetical protein
MDRAKCVPGTVLKSIGFVEDPTVAFSDPPGLSFNFGNFKLFAGSWLNRSFQPVVSLYGLKRHAYRSTCRKEVESREQLVSLVVVEIRFFGIRAWNFSFTIAL